MTPWEGPSFRYPIPLFLGILNRLTYLVVSTSLPSPFTMEGPIMLNM